MRAKIIAVWGYKGKTTFAVNLAWSLVKHKNDKIVTLLSSNLTFGDLQGHFGQTILDKNGLLHALVGEERPRKYLWKAGNDSIWKDIFLMALPNEYDSLLVEEPTLDRVEALVEDLSATESTDYLIVDCSGDLHNPITGAALAMTDTIILLHNPGWASYHWYRGMRSFRDQLSLDSKTSHLISGHDRSCNVSQYIDELNLTILDEIPHVSNARFYENNGTPICSEESRATRSYREAMQRICLWL